MRRLLALPLPARPPAPAAQAWSALGHRLVGDLAERHIQPATAEASQTLLAGEPDPTLAGVANGPTTCATPTPTRFKATSRWHYVNTIDGNCHYEPPRDCPDGHCVIGAIAGAARDPGRPVRRPAVAARRTEVPRPPGRDAHQPMHAATTTTRVATTTRSACAPDAGPPTSYASRYVDGVMGTNLHAIWDYYVLASAGIGRTPLFRAACRAIMAAGCGCRANPAVWAGESCRLVDAQALYPAGHAMDTRYLIQQRPLAELRIRQAAYRLATLLDDALDH